MPRKIRQLIADLEKAGFTLSPGKGSHRKYRKPNGPTIILSGKSGDDARHYQENDVRRAIAAAREETK